MEPSGCVTCTVEPASRETNIAKKIWHNVMEQIHAELPSQAFYVPTGVIQYTVCKDSGLI